MLADDSKALLALLTDLDRARRVRRLCDALAERQEELQAIKAEVDRADNVYLALSKREAIRVVVDGTKSLSYATELRSALSTDPESMTKGRGFTYFKSSFKKLVDAINTACAESWQTHRDKLQPRVDSEQLELAKQIPGHQQDAERLEYLASTMKRQSNVPPESEQAFVDIEKRWQDIRDLIARLPQPTKNPEIQAFLKAANSREGASLELLTDQVRSWLANSAIGKKFRVRPA